MSSPHKSGRMNGTTVTMEGTSSSSFQMSRLPQLHDQDQKSCLQRGMAHFQLTLRDYLLREPQNDRLLWLWRVGKPSALRNQLPPYKLVSSYQALKRPRKSHFQELR
ncbi:hypothetical protein AVEN_233055-1 [Araneus ventricosus]|uniref:Uncharacterized protein n=1 Tax=Araneus ventricosus TaxID=182803 RepID=A0A4Y2URQ9_ARAVE|nr:hypothetical protein AVEN_233055-1 [Araneus ventricosus]